VTVALTTILTKNFSTKKPQSWAGSTCL